MNPYYDSVAYISYAHNRLQRAIDDNMALERLAERDPCAYEFFGPFILENLYLNCYRAAVAVLAARKDDTHGPEPVLNRLLQINEQTVGLSSNLLQLFQANYQDWHNYSSDPENLDAVKRDWSGCIKKTTRFVEEIETWLESCFELSYEEKQAAEIHLAEFAKWSSTKNRILNNSIGFISDETATHYSR